jgi:opacity protein-like surface antigen
MKKLLTLAIATITTAPLSTYANNDIQGLIIGAGYQKGIYKEEDFDSASPSQIQFKIGKEITDNFVLRFDYYVGLSDDSIEVFGDTVEIEVDSAWSVLAQPKLPLNDQASVYGLVGFSSGKLTVSVPEYDYSASDDDSGVSFGAGIEFNIDQGVGLYAEYVSYLRDEDYDYFGFNLGVSKTF